MKKKQWARIFLAGILAVIPAILFTGCKSEENLKASPAYYVISEELDVQKTTEKAHEILENAEPK